MFGRPIAFILFSATAMVAAVSSPAFAADTSRISYDSQCVTIDGKDMVLFSGAFHYFRCPKELWSARFKKLKEAGFNTLETYAAWNYHEQTPPSDPDDFSKLDMTELHDWLAMATDQFGFQIILRPGPYICAEWDGGGYPQWLLAKRPASYKGKEWYRTDEPTYLAWSKHWYAAVAKVAVPFQVTHRPAGKAGIILWQIENEYDYSGLSATIKRNQLVFLAHASKDLGIDVPLTTCLTSNKAFRNDEYLKKNVIETRNTYPKFDMSAMWRDIGMLYQYQPEKFKMITELQGGWFAQVGGKLSEEQGFDQTHINNITLNAWENGFTATNYYMGFGGTNLGDWAAQRLTTTYDYDAPLRECGGVSARYFAVKALGQFITDHGSNLARSVMEDFDVKSKTDTSLHVAVRRGKDGSRYLFVRNEEKGTLLKGTLTLQTRGANSVTISTSYDLGSFGGKVLYLPPGKTADTDGVWYPKPQDQPERPTDLPAPIVLTSILEKADSGPSEWKPFQTDQTGAEAGLFNRQFVFYRSTIPVTTLPAGSQLSLLAQLPGLDWAGVAIDGKIIPAASAGRFVLGAPVATEQPITLLYENAGRPNFGNGIDQSSGLLNPHVVASSDQPIALNDWKELHIERRYKPKAELEADFDDKAWAAADITTSDGDIKPGNSGLYRTTFAMTDAQVKAGKILTIGRIDDDGVVYVNGTQVGSSHDWTQAQHFDISKQLRAGKNSIVVQVTNREGGGGVSKGAELEPIGTAIPTTWEFSQKTAGVAGQWWNTDLNDSDWKPATKDHAPSLLTWYRMKFELPATKPNEWIPWRLKLNAAGNGFLYLNGHALGRYWEAGPQSDFFLPECWLNFGAGKTNVITLEMRPTDAPTQIRSAEVRPYENFAEMR